MKPLSPCLYEKNILIQSFFSYPLSGLAPLASSSTASLETPSTQTMDVLEGENVLLECRFPPSKVDTSRATLYWIRSNRDGHDNAAIGDNSLDDAYS